MGRNTFIDPWLKKGSRDSSLPSGLKLVCAYELHLGVDSVAEALFYCVDNNQHQLWAVAVYSDKMLNAIHLKQPNRIPGGLTLHSGLAVSLSDSSPDSTQMLDLLELLVVSRAGCGWPSNFLKRGLLCREDFDNKINKIEMELNQIREQTFGESIGNPLIEKARKLRLKPEPCGTAGHQWKARCPETHHYLYISTDSNTFGCGYCRRKGGVKELINFASERKARYGSCKYNLSEQIAS